MHDIVPEYMKDPEERLREHQKAMDQEKERGKPNVMERMDKDAADTLDHYDFWCESCQEDFEAPCYKTRHRIYGNTIAVYRAKCPECEGDALRHVTHKDEDRYYQKSTKIHRARKQYEWEYIQPGQYGFKSLYGEPYKEFQERLQLRERRIVEGEREKGLKGLSLHAKDLLARNKLRRDS